MTLVRVAWIVFAASGLVACTPEGGCRTTITGNTNTVTQACGGPGDDSGATVTTPAPVIVPPVQVVPIVPSGGGG